MLLACAKYAKNSMPRPASTKDRPTARPNTGFMILTAIRSISHNMDGRFDATRATLSGPSELVSTLKLLSSSLEELREPRGESITPASSFQLDINLKTKLRSRRKRTERSNQEGITYARE